MKLMIAFLMLLSAANATPTPSSKEAAVVLTRITVNGNKIPSGWLTVAWLCKGPLPTDAVKRAWISNVLPDSPADKAGVSIDDHLLAIGGMPVDKLTGVTLRWHMEREHDLGTQEEFLLQTPGGEQRLVVLKFEKNTGH